ncbi:hypothetical protein [Sphingomonas sp. LHG3406-1]|uniref:hypothetical protein n=1 Tax=Sphingomonas sp. LHG3406-1 TaxID=2804617 RepID=UPI002622A6A9|nr:hypothetical protein [Sphingomonas sp. LHG3406-1]
MRTNYLLAVVASALALSGCVASIAAGAIGAAARGSQQGRNVYYNDEAVKLAAATACRAQAAPYGTVAIIDIEQRSPTKATVWGTATGSTERRSFECRFDRKVVGFKTAKL